MKLLFASGLIVLAHLIPGFHAVPMPTGERCSCQPLEPFTRHSESYNSSLASCNRIAKQIERWRWPSHAPKLADAFVDFSSLELGPGSILPSLHDRPQAIPAIPPDTDPPRRHLHLKQIERHQILDSALRAESQRGTYFEAQQRFRIVCHPRSPVIEPYAPQTLYSFAGIFIGMALVWLFVFEFAVKLWLRWSEAWQSREGVIALSGDEKRLYAAASSDNHVVDVLLSPEVHI